MNEETIKDFKIIFVKYGFQTTLDKFYQLFSQHKDYELSILLIFFYLLINWSKVKQVKEINEYLISNKIFHLGGEREYF